MQNRQKGRGRFEGNMHGSIQLEKCVKRVVKLVGVTFTHRALQSLSCPLCGGDKALTRLYEIGSEEQLAHWYRAPTIHLLHPLHLSPWFRGFLGPRVRVATLVGAA
jgi:hypothetical protein